VQSNVDANALPLFFEGAKVWLLSGVSAIKKAVINAC
jgi:hypothetical protein